MFSEGATKRCPKRKIIFDIDIDALQKLFMPTFFVSKNSNKNVFLFLITMF